MIQSLEGLLREAEIAHGHLCAGQILGVRLALVGLGKLGIVDPRGKDRKRLVTFVEIDRCATDAIAVVTGCRLGKRALKFRDWGKMAATFVDLSTKLPSHTNLILGEATTSPSELGAESKASYALNPGELSQRILANNSGMPSFGEPTQMQPTDTGHWYRAIRVAAKESSKQRSRELHPEIENKNRQQMLAYRELSDDDLFTTTWVKVELLPEEFPGYKSDRITCSRCGEGINFHREVVQQGKIFCRYCAGDEYYRVL
jgi:formylmethanofuran dehydrogenase subunit E